MAFYDRPGGTTYVELLDPHTIREDWTYKRVPVRHDDMKLIAEAKDWFFDCTKHHYEGSRISCTRRGWDRTQRFELEAHEVRDNRSISSALPPLFLKTLVDRRGNLFFSVECDALTREVGASSIVVGLENVSRFSTRFAIQKTLDAIWNYGEGNL